jgi:hypothetical protein
MRDYLIEKALLQESGFEVFVEDRRQRVLERVRELLGR